MQLRADAKLPFPRPQVFAAYRDKLVDLLPYLPNVRKIDVKSRDENGKTVKLLNVWHGGGVGRSRDVERGRLHHRVGDQNARLHGGR